MKLLFDQNLSHKLCDALEGVFPGSSQTRRLGLDRADDRTVWREAAAGGYVLVTQDVDFRNLSAQYGAPPKVVLLRCGNQPTPVIERLLWNHVSHLHAFELRTDLDLIEIA